MSKQAKSGIMEPIPAKIRRRKGVMVLVFKCPHWERNHPRFKNHWIRCSGYGICGYNKPFNVTLPCGGLVNLEIVK